MSEAVKTQRIVQRITDGLILTWSPVLAKRTDFRGGTVHLDKNGKHVKLDLDSLGSADLARAPGISERERTLMEQNQALQARLKALEGGAVTTTAANTTLTPTGLITADAQAETPLPPPPDNLKPIDLSAPPPAPVEESIEFQPEPTMITEPGLRRLNKEQLIVHAHDVKRTVNLPDAASKGDLVEICLELQTQYMANLES